MCRIVVFRFANQLAVIGMTNGTRSDFNLKISVVVGCFSTVRGSAVDWWLMPRTPDPEVGGSSPTRVKPCCVLEQGKFTPLKYW